MKSILGIFLSTLLSLVNSYQQLTPPTPTTAEIFPYHASIQLKTRWCAGALISNNFILTTASCLSNDTILNLNLGFSRNPRYSTRKSMDENEQIYEVKEIYAEQIYIHEDFGYLEPTKHPINDFALIKLGRDIVLSKKVQPIPIGSPDDFPIPPGTFINQTGFQNLNIDGTLLYATVQERNIDLCKAFYGNSFLPSHERCVKHKGEQRMSWVGLHVVNGILIGFQRNFQNATCNFTLDCKGTDVYITLEPALLWIYRISGVAGVNGKELLDGDNPFWKPEKIQSAHQSNGDSLADNISKGIYLGIKRLVCCKN